MREIHRTIVSALIFSKDGKLLMGMKDPEKGGVYSDSWHIPGGGIDEGETFEEALEREILEETGISVSSYNPVPIGSIGKGTSEKTLKTGERVLCHMEFNRFRVDIDQDAEDIALTLNDDLVTLKWFSRDELQNAKQIPGGSEFFREIGIMD